MDRGINLARVIPRMGKPESEYTPRLLLVLVENLGEGTAFMASVTGVPAMRDWTSVHDLLAAIHNTGLNSMLIHVDASKRKGFEYIKSPMTEYHEKLKRDNQRRGRKALLEDVSFDDADIPPELLGIVRK